MKKVEAVIFDMDGLLFDTEQIGFKVWKDTCEKYGYKMDEEIFFSIISRNASEIREIMKTAYGEEFNFDVCYKEKNEMAAKEIENNGVPIKVGATELIDYLNEEGYKIALATSTRRERAYSLLSKSNLTDKFSYIICGDQVERSKPDPDIFLKVAKALEVKAKNCLVLEDSGPGIRAAAAAKMIPINIPDMKEPDEEIRKLSYKVFDSLLDVKELLENV